MHNLQKRYHEARRGMLSPLFQSGRIPGKATPERTFPYPLLLIFLLILLGLPSPVSAGETRIAFLEFQVNGRDLDKDLGTAASERVQNVVVRSSRVFVVERTQFKNLAKEHELQYSALVDESTAIEIGKIAGADYVVLGSLNAMGSILFLTARLVDVQRGLVIEGFEVTSKKGVEGLYYALGDLGTQIVTTLHKKGIAEVHPGAIPPTPKPAAPTPTPKPAPTYAPKTPVLPPTVTPMPIDPSKSFSQGLQAFNTGRLTEAAGHWQNASRAGHLEATARLGECYYHGWGVGKNSGKAFSLLKDAAERGSSYARGVLHGIDPAKFASYRADYLALRKEEGTPSKPQAPAPTQAPAPKTPPLFLDPPKPTTPKTLSPQEMFDMGKNYYYGRNGKAKDYTQAAIWYRKAAELGHADARTNLGYLYEKGLGVPQSLEYAVEWYLKGAYAGSAAGQANLGYFYEAGRGVPQDYEKAVSWYRKAADQGYPRGQCNLGYMYEMGRGIPQSYTEAARWYKKAAEQGYTRGEFNLGYVYEKGQGVSQSYAEAARWYQKAANQGYAAAENNLGHLYETGEGVPRDFQKALLWYRKAADHGNEYGMFNLGKAYEYGTGVGVNLNTALSWYRKAAAKGHGGARDALSRLGEKP